MTRRHAPAGSTDPRRAPRRRDCPSRPAAPGPGAMDARPFAGGGERSVRDRLPGTLRGDSARSAYADRAGGGHPSPRAAARAPAGARSDARLGARVGRRYGPVSLLAHQHHARCRLVHRRRPRRGAPRSRDLFMRDAAARLLPIRRTVAPAAGPVASRSVAVALGGRLHPDLQRAAVDRTRDRARRRRDGLAEGSAPRAPPRRWPA